MSANITSDYIFAPPVVADASLPAVFTANAHGLAKAEYCRTNSLPLVIWLYGDNESVLSNAYFSCSGTIAATINSGSPVTTTYAGSIYSLQSISGTVAPGTMWYGPGIFHTGAWEVQRAAVVFNAADLGSSPCLLYTSPSPRD